MQDIKIILLGTQTSMAQSILEQLALHNYPAHQVVLLDHHQNSPRSIEYLGEEKPIQPIDLYEWRPPYIALLCDKTITKNYPKRKIPKHAWLIDCTGVISEAPCIIPNLNSNCINPSGNHILCAPTSMSVILCHILADLIPLKIRKIQTVALAGTSFLGGEIANALNEQTRAVYGQICSAKDHNKPPLAFNLIPQIIPQSNLTSPYQVKCILGQPIDFRHCFVPVFRGFAIYVSCQIHQPPHKKLWAQNPFIHVMDKNDSGFILSTAATLSETKIFITHVQHHKDCFSFWAVGDDLQTGMAFNTIHIIETLMQKFI